jgi:antitoxin YefM
MEAITYTAARQNLAKTMEKVCRDHAPMIVTRKSSESVVIMSLEDFESLEETAYLLRSPQNTRRLIESIAQLENGNGIEKELIEWNSFFLPMPGMTTSIGKKPIKKFSTVSTPSLRKQNETPLRVLENPNL